MDLKITTVQADLIWEDKTHNLSKFDNLLRGCSDSDIIVLPEMFTTAFSMKPETLAEPLFGETFKWMTQKARELNAVITGSFICVENQQYFNRLIWMQPDGNYFKYDKRHLFTLAGENTHYTEGSERITIEWKGWRICPLICYDLRFPVWSRNTTHFNLNEKKTDTKGYYDIVLYVANWPERRSHAWKSLLMARAIENQAYVVGVNRVGSDGNDVTHSGDSSIIDYAGNILFQQSYTEGVHTTILSDRKLTNFRNKFGFLFDQDNFSIQSVI
jgi:omega-amidase